MAGVGCVLALRDFSANMEICATISKLLHKQNVPSKPSHRHRTDRTRAAGLIFWFVSLPQEGKFWLVRVYRVYGICDGRNGESGEGYIRVLTHQAPHYQSLFTSCRTRPLRTIVVASSPSSSLLKNCHCQIMTISGIMGPWSCVVRRIEPAPTTCLCW